jgi:predicted HD phosphohydrolase
MSKTVSFTRMADGTREDYEYLDGLWKKLWSTLPDQVLAMLKTLEGDKLGYAVDRYQHSLQSATHAFRDGADEEMVVAALLHDMGDTLAPENHADLAAAILRPYVTPDTHWIVKHHAIFQGYYFWHHLGGDRDARDKYRSHPLFERTAMFCERWDQNCFDPAYDTMPIEAFEPMLRRLFARQPWQYAREDSPPSHPVAGVTA